ncbi:NADH-quinone oxidoreductase subunit F [Ardenticatena maritima]|uniref:NADH-quinone oxidoreductase subunit F n=1 Tax=Ardenticatena maritima TaxID=872965 RepID=A0A0M9UE01_9CHLR|nr:NADH-quinone oxidoreductase subunit F [Ardenticatena maritima]
MALDDILDRWKPYGRAGLLPCLIETQERIGWLPPDACAAIGQALRVPLADVYGVVEFYALLYTTPTGKLVLRVCDDVACFARGSAAVVEACSRLLGIQPGETTPDGRFTLEVHPCLGQCDRAPAALRGFVPVGELTPENVQAALLGDTPAPPPDVVSDAASLLLRRVGRVDPDDLAAYEADGGYAALRRALDVGAEAVIAEVKASGLFGRGGAAFPTGVKWESAARQSERTRYVVCNADESEPGTFKDRVLMEGDPFAIVEGLTIAGYAIGAQKGFIYVRGEYREAFERLQNAVAQARAAGYLGENVLGSGFAFDIEVRRGAGAYICGEETALFESIEGKRGMPRQKPPFPTEKGLFGKPTVINNVETLANVPHIVQHGAAWFRQIGNEDAPGPKLFCVSGNVARPGVYEAPMTTTLRELLTMAGGVADGRNVQAILLGGAAGTFISPDALDTPLTPSALRAIGATLGSGAVIVFDDRVPMLDVLARIGRFFAHESCGKCYPCQLGTQRQWEMVQRWQAAGRVLMEDLPRFNDLAATMRDASICGLGQTAASAIASWVQLRGYEIV